MNEELLDDILNNADADLAQELFDANEYQLWKSACEHLIALNKIEKLNIDQLRFVYAKFHVEKIGNKWFKSIFTNVLEPFERT